MQYTQAYQSPLGKILMACDDAGLTGLWFEGQYAHTPGDQTLVGATPVFNQVKNWLDTYFSSQKPDFTPPLHMRGSPFQLLVWNLLLQIPYGQTATYGELAKLAADKLGKSRMSAQAIGGAVGHNLISIIVPCHRVIGSNGSLTGYGGGIDKKARLLALEGYKCGAACLA